MSLPLGPTRGPSRGLSLTCNPFGQIDNHLITHQWCCMPPLHIYVYTHSIYTLKSCLSFVSDCWLEPDQRSSWWLIKGKKHLLVHYITSIRSPFCCMLISLLASSCSACLLCAKPLLLWKRHWWVAMWARWPQTSIAVRCPKISMTRWSAWWETHMKNLLNNKQWEQADTWPDPFIICLCQTWPYTTWSTA